MSEGAVVGIDLGTTYSCVGVFRFGKVEIIANDQGNKITPSYVAFTENETLVGDPAKHQSTRNYENTIFDVKRLIGRKFTDSTVQDDIKQWPFKVVSDGTAHNNPKIKVKYAGKTETYCPEVISSMVLQKMKNTAEAYLGKPVKKAVITVPAYFNDSQREATIDAAHIAGLEVLRLINEPTAAALAYGCDQNIREPRNVLIFDLGGGTFDVSIVCIQDGVFEVISTAGNTHLGGEDFDNRMVDYCAKEFLRVHRKDLTQNKKALRRLKTECERAKRALSSAVTETIDICNLHDGIDFLCSITRARFESLNMDLFQSAMNSVEKALRDANMDKTNIHDIVLVGGSSRIPKIQKLLQDYFPIKELKKSINPDQAVAYGAAVEAAILNGDKSKEILDSVLIDVTPLSLGIESDMWCENAGRVLKKQMDVILKRNTAIPNRKTKRFTTAFDNQDFIDIEVYEGEYAVAKDNHFLGKFVLNNIPPRSEGEPKIDVTFDIDANGVLNVSAVEKSTGVKNEITISFAKGRLSKEEIGRLIHDAEEKKRNADNRNYASIAKNALESYCVNMKQIIKDEKLKSKIKKFDKELIQKKCDETITWLHSGPPLEKTLFDNKQNELESVCDLIVTMASDPDVKIQKFREILKVEKGASKEEIENAFREIALVRHPDKVKGDKDLGKWMWLTILAAKQALLCGSGTTKRKFDAV